MDIIFKAVEIKSNKWVYGAFVPFDDGDYIINSRKEAFLVKRETVCQKTQFSDAFGAPIFEGDIVSIFVDEEQRLLTVDRKKIVRKILNHPDFVEDIFPVEIDGIVFSWQGYDLLPCTYAQKGSDTLRMKVVGDKFFGVKEEVYD